MLNLKNKASLETVLSEIDLKIKIIIKTDSFQCLKFVFLLLSFFYEFLSSSLFWFDFFSSLKSVWIVFDIQKLKLLFDGNVFLVVVVDDLINLNIIIIMEYLIFSWFFIFDTKNKNNFFLTRKIKIIFFLQRKIGWINNKLNSIIFAK